MTTVRRDPAVPKPTVVMVPLPAPRVVVIRWDGKREPRVALMVSQSETGEFLAVRLAQGLHRRYSKKVRRILAVEMLRDATAREVELGRVPLDSWR